MMTGCLEFIAIHVFCIIIALRDSLYMFCRHVFWCQRLSDNTDCYTFFETFLDFWTSALDATLGGWCHRFLILIFEATKTLKTETWHFVFDVGEDSTLKMCVFLLVSLPQGHNKRDIVNNKYCPDTQVQGSNMFQPSRSIHCRHCFGTSVYQIYGSWGCICYESMNDIWSAL